MRHFILVISGLLLGLVGFAQNDYHNASQLEQELNKIANSNRSIFSLKTLATTVGGKKILVLEAGIGDRDNKPAIALVGGVEGAHLLSQELALGFAKGLQAGMGMDSIKSILNKVTFYFLPQMSPDAATQYHARLRYERSGNANPSDLDRDGRVGEDPFEDLNKDGLITQLRIESPSGKWRVHPDDSRLMVLADASKGERGTHHVYSEGYDNDRDGQYNEDGEEGVILNKNFTFQYPAFTPGAGEHSVSEVETRAIADYLFDRWNVHTVVIFGPSDNLVNPWSYNSQKAGKRIIESVMEADEKDQSFVASQYKKIIDPQGAGKGHFQAGGFAEWAYFHYTRYSLSTPGWWIPPVPEEGADEPGKKKKHENETMAFVQWAEHAGLEDYFVPWTPVDHPEFKDQKAEVGGIKPFLTTNPPYILVEEIVNKHNAFLISLAEMMPALEWVNIKTEKAGKLTRVTAELVNHGQVPTNSELGERSKWLKKIKVSIKTEKGQELVSGRTVELVDRIGAGGSVTHSWLVNGKGKVTLEGGAPHTGIATTVIELK